MHMRKKLTETIILVTIFLSSIFPVMAGQEIVPADVTVKVQYQRMRPASPMVRRKRDFFEWEFTKKMNAVGL